MTQLWLKYRPDTMQNMVGLEAVKKDSASWVVGGKLRCGGVIFYGGPGTGKTSAARAFAMDALGPSFDANFHVFNASDDRGIAFVRDRLKPLAEQKATGHGFKVINLDEADGLTVDAQEAMRQIIETTSTHVLWILTCNRVGRIIPALRSRLPSYQFGGLDGDEAESFLEHVMLSEAFPSQWVEQIPLLIKHTNGDMRACLKTLQVCDPKDESSLIAMLHANRGEVQNIHGLVCERQWDVALERIEHVGPMGRDDFISAFHDSIMERVKGGFLPAHVALLQLLILGQWAARSSDWVAGDFLFLRAMLGDYMKRC